MSETPNTDTPVVPEGQGWPLDPLVEQLFEHYRQMAVSQALNPTSMTEKLLNDALLVLRAQIRRELEMTAPRLRLWAKDVGDNPEDYTVPETRIAFAIRECPAYD